MTKIMFACSIVLLFGTTICGEARSAQPNADLTTHALEKIKLINELVRLPAQATVKNAEILLGPHSETELRFWMNSRTDGTVGNYAPNSPAQRALVKHSQNNRAASAFLEHLRLSILAYMIRPGAQVPHFDLSHIQWVRKKTLGGGGTMLFANTRLSATNAEGRPIYLPATFEFEIVNGLGDKSRLYIYKIKIKTNEVFRWWDN